MKEVHTINYYSINEGAARRAKEMNSFSDYKEGSATAEYRAMVDKAAAIAEQQKSRVDPMYHEKIDHLLDTYARKLAENMNQGFAIDARVPSVMIAGPANFPVGKKEKQNRARDSNMEEWRYIQGLLDKIRSTGMGGISADDPAAIEKLQKKLDGLERSQLIMKEVNAYYRKHGKLDGCALLSPDQIEKLKAILVHERDRKGSIQTTQEIEIYFNFVGRFVPPAFGEVELTPEELEEIRKREERKDRLHQNYLKRKASGAQKRYEDKIKGRKKAEIEAKKAAIRAEDIAKGVFVPVSSLPQREPMKGVQTA